METTETNTFAATEAALIRRACTDAEWADLIQHRPGLPEALAAYRRMAAVRAEPAES